MRARMVILTLYVLYVYIHHIQLDTDVNDDDIRTNTAHVIQLCESVLSRVCGMLYMCPVYVLVLVCIILVVLG